MRRWSGKRERRIRAAAVALATCALAAAAVASPAAAEPSEREEYRALAEPICERNATANRHILRGVRARVRQGKLGAAGRQFARSARALRRAVRQLRRVPRPESDAERLSRWLGRLSGQATLLRRTGAALVDGRRHHAGRLVSRLSRGARLANAIVVGFEFRHCRLEPSRYS